MMVDPEQLVVRHHPQHGRFEIQAGESLAILQYHIVNDDMFITHTEVPPNLEGQGVASRLAQAGLDYARENSYRVIPLCSFVEAYIKRHTEYQPLVRS